MSEFMEFRKIPRLNRDVVISEKIDGTNAQVLIRAFGDGETTTAQPVATVNEHRLWAGSRNRWVTPDKDHYGFARWVADNAAELVSLFGPGRVFGEWWGAGVQRKYGLTAKRFSLFNVGNYGEVTEHRDTRCFTAAGHQVDRAGVVRCACRTARPALNATVGGVLIEPVPVLYRGPWFQERQWAPDAALDKLRREGSVAAPGFMQPEGIVVFHEASGQLFKATLSGDEKPKGVN